MSIFLLIFEKRKMQNNRSIICLLGEPGSWKALAIDSNFTRNAPEVRGHLTKCCSSKDPLTCVVSFTKIKFYFYTVVLSYFSVLLSSPFAHLLQRFSFPFTFFSPAIIFECVGFLPAISWGGWDRLVFFIIAHSVWKNIALCSTGMLNTKKQTNTF